MRKAGKKPIIGILGGIGSGKSTVAGQFAKLGCKVIDADAIAHELLERTDVIQKVKASFGQAILNSEGKIDRSKLGKIVFGDPAKISILNEIIHPLVLARTEALIKGIPRSKRGKSDSSGYAVIAGSRVGKTVRQAYFCGLQG